MHVFLGWYLPIQPPLKSLPSTSLQHNFLKTRHYKQIGCKLWSIIKVIGMVLRQALCSALNILNKNGRYKFSQIYWYFREDFIIIQLFCDPLINTHKLHNESKFTLCTSNDGLCTCSINPCKTRWLHGIFTVATDWTLLHAWLSINCIKKHRTKTSNRKWTSVHHSFSPNSLQSLLTKLFYCHSIYQAVYKL